MADIPNQIEKFSEVEIDAFSTIAQANWTKVSQMLEYAHLSFPVGMLLFFFASQDNVPEQPDSKYWKFMDGTAVSNANSIYDGLTVPDLRGRFFKHPATGDMFPVLDGTNFISIAHDHGGFSDYASDSGAVQLDGGGEVQGAFGTHRHSIAVGATTVPKIPAYQEVQVYMRIL